MTRNDQTFPTNFYDNMLEFDFLFEIGMIMCTILGILHEIIVGYVRM